MKKLTQILTLLAVAFAVSSCGQKTTVEIYDFPAEYEASQMWSVKCGGEEVFVTPTEEPHLASLGCDGKVKLTDDIRDYYRKYGGAPHLDGQYTVFGEVVEGMTVVRDIDYVRTDDYDRPVDDVRIIKATVVK